MEPVKDFNKIFNAMRLVTLLTIGGFFFSSALFFYLYHSKAEEVGKKVYVITDRGTFAAINADKRKTSIYEARNHVKTFMATMFAHDAATYSERVEAALNLIDERSGKKIFNDFEEGQVHENYVRYNSRTDIDIDSIKINMGAAPLAGKVYARQNVYFGDNKKALPIAASFTLEETYRNDHNPFGLVLKNFDFIAYYPEEQE